MPGHMDRAVRVRYILVTLTVCVQCTQGWAQWNETEFCRSVKSCIGNPGSNETAASAEEIKHHDNDTARICELARQCSTTGNTDKERSPNITDFESDAMEHYQRNTSTSEFCSVLNSCEYVNKSDGKHEYKINFLRNISHYCPYSDYCGLSKSLTIPARDNTSMSCCATCSCSPDCGIHRECCFWEDDKYRTAETENLTCATLKVAGVPASFLVVDTCPNGTKCNDQDTVPMPVSSALTKRIYINSRCAQCHINVTYTKSAYISWTVSIQFQTKAHHVWNCLEDNTCFRLYDVPPLHWPWIVNFACGREYRNACPLSTRDLDLVAACRNIHAPLVMSHSVFGRGLFANIYCVMCQGNLISSYTSTKLCDRIIGLTPIKGASLSILLDFDVIHKHKQAENCDKNTSHGAVQKQQVACRAVLCPEWMLEVNGKCRHFTKQWKNSYIGLQLTLRPYNKQIKARIFQNMTKDSQFNVHTWLSNECSLSLYRDNPDRWVDINVFMLPIKIQNVQVVKEFILRMEYFWAYLKPSSLLAAIKRCLDRRWKITQDSNEYYLSAQFYQYKRFMPDGRTKRTHVSLNNTYSESPLPKVYEPVTVSKPFYYRGTEQPSAQLRRDAVIISKMAFCKRVEIPLADVDLLFGQIRIRSSNTTLSDGQFNAEYTGKILTHIYVCKENDLRNESVFSSTLSSVTMIAMLVGSML